MIPKKIHQTAKTSDIPERWKGFRDRVTNLHPGWEYKLWTDSDNHALVAGSALRWLGLYEAMPRNIMRADMIRYIILQSFGGVYLDLDYEFFRPFDLLHETLVLPRQSGGEDVHLGNCILASAPGHPFWDAVLSEMEHGVTKLGRAPLEDEVIWLTGPGLLTRVYKELSKTDHSICTPPGNQFHPPVPTNESEYETLRETQAVYGVHHCDGTWRARTVGQRIGRKLSTLRARLQRRGAAPG